MAIRVNPSLSQKIYSFGSNCVLKDVPLGGATPTSLVDKSGYGNDSASWSGCTPGQLSSGLWYYDLVGSSDSAILTANDIFSQATFGAGCSLVAWAYLDLLHDQDQDILDIEARFRLFVHATTDLLAFQIYDGAANEVTSNSAIVTSTWYFTVGTWDGTDMHLYVNGELQTETTTSNVGLIDSVSRPVSIGAYHIPPTSTFELNGRITLARIMPTALSLSNIRYMYNYEKGYFDSSGHRLKITP